MPKIIKVVINVGAKELARDKTLAGKLSEELALISGQKPSLRRAKKAIAGFQLGKGDPVGLMVTLRGKRMRDFLKRLLTIVLPRIRDFQGISPASFDGRGNLTLGISEQVVFPEIDFNKIDKVHGLEVTIVTNSKNDDEAKKLVEGLGMPIIWPRKQKSLSN